MISAGKKIAKLSLGLKGNFIKAYVFVSIAYYMLLVPKTGPSDDMNIWNIDARQKFRLPDRII